MSHVKYQQRLIEKHRLTNDQVNKIAWYGWQTVFEELDQVAKQPSQNDPAPRQRVLDDVDDGRYAGERGCERSILYNTFDNQILRQKKSVLLIAWYFIGDVYHEFEKIGKIDSTKRRSAQRRAMIKAINDGEFQEEWGRR